MLWYIDLIFGMWVYNDELQIKYTFRSDWMILMIFGMRVYNHKLQVNFKIRSGWMILANYTLSYQKASQYLKSEWNKVVTTKYLTKFQSPMAVCWPKIIQPERISKLFWYESV
jgi:hypothetical protein